MLRTFFGRSVVCNEKNDIVSDISEQTDDGLLPGIHNQLKALAISFVVFDNCGVPSPDFKRLLL